MSKRKMSATEKLYAKYEYLADHYSNNIYGYEKFGYERDDIIQELRIRIYKSIISYSKKFEEYLRTNRYKPVPLLYYIKTSMVNKVKDMIKQFNSDEKFKVSMDEMSVDHALYSSAISEIDLDRCVVVINGVDILQNMCRREKICFCLFLKGFSISKLTSMFRVSGLNAESMISKQIQSLQCKKQQLLDFTVKEFTSIRSFEE